MSEPFLSEIKIWGLNFAPRGFAMCNGQILPINQYQALFSLLGTTFGGDGRTNFALPDLRGRAPMSFGDGAGLSPRSLGATGGTETQALTTTEVPPHTHNLVGAVGTTGASPIPSNGVMLGSSRAQLYSSSAANTTLAASSVAAVGGQGHENRQPYLALNFCIAIAGVFPSRN